MKRDIQNYVLGKWTSGDGLEYEALHAITGESLGKVSSYGLDYNGLGRNLPSLYQLTTETT